MLRNFRPTGGLLLFVLLVFCPLSYAQDDLIAEASALDTGMGAELYFYITQPTNSFEDVVEVLPAHMDFVHAIEDEGSMVMGGQITPEGLVDAGGRGLIVIRAASFEEARSIADRDPMHKTGVRNYELYKWNVNEGSTTIKVKFSDQTFDIDWPRPGKK